MKIYYMPPVADIFPVFRGGGRTCRESQGACHVKIDQHRNDWRQSSWKAIADKTKDHGSLIEQAKRLRGNWRSGLDKFLRPRPLERWKTPFRKVT